jgi:hypothetical protein
MPGKRKLAQAAESALALEQVQAERRYTSSLDRLCADYAYLGASDEDIAGFIGISPDTFSRWKADQPTLARRLLRARELGLAKVARSLHAAANGYKHKETKVLVVDGAIQRVDVVKHYPPNVNAAALLLVNRDSKRWKDRKLADATVTLDLGELVREALERRDGSAARVIEGELSPASVPMVSPDSGDQSKE